MGSAWLLFRINKEVGLSRTAGQRGRGGVISSQTWRQHSWYKAGPWRQVWLILVGEVCAGEQVSGHQHPGIESHGGHFLHTLSPYSL